MKYYPILLSKAGEFKALRELNPVIKNEISPIIQILRDSMPRVETSLLRDWSFLGNQVLLDFSTYEQLTGTDVIQIKQLFENLISGGVNAVPVIQHNTPVLLINLVRELVIRLRCNVCIRASNDGGGLNNYIVQSTALMRKVGSTQQTTILLIDLGYAEAHNYNLLSALVVPLINSIPNLVQWLDIVVASGSFPVNVSHLLPPDRLYKLRRYEWDIWKAINTNPNIRGIIKYGDYGNKNPVYSGEAGYAGSCSVKYTTENEFFVYRGILSRDHANGNGQYIIFAERLIQTPQFSGAGFSWGDSQIDRIAREVLTDPKNRPGSATTWVEVTQNHHITLLHSHL